MTGWEPVIGLELHVQLATLTKMFCGCATVFDAEPNTQICAVCFGIPGALPVPNGAAVRAGVRLALALGAHVHPVSRFARKSYIYPDLPKGYQISQEREPLATGGAMPLGDGRSTPLVRLHLEEDAGRSLNREPGWRRVDLNRAGVPLIEVVSQPALRSPEDAIAFMKSARGIVRALGVSDGNLEEGSLRCDANVSLRRAGTEAFGVRVEIKNINSFRFVGQALSHEIERQRLLLDRGEAVEQQTRGWDEKRGITFALRGKEQARDYRYFPEPDLPPLVLTSALIAAERAALVPLPHARADRYRTELGLLDDAARSLAEDRATAEWFERGLDAIGGGDVGRSQALANTIRGELFRRFNADGGTVADLPFGPERLVALNDLVGDGELTADQARNVLDVLWTEDGEPAEIARRHGWSRVDTSAVERAVRDVLEAHADEVARFKAGEVKLRGFLVGRVMVATRGAADPRTIQELLGRLLAE